MSARDQPWIDAFRENVNGYRRMIDQSVAQLTDEELMRRPAAGMNSVAVLLRHLGGNLRSRWTDFLTTDGEKPDRNRDTEFEDWQGDRDSLMRFLDDGWSCLTTALDQMAAAKDLETPIFIRGEQHTIAEALVRSVAHMSYHVGQIMMISRMVHVGQWDWLSIPPGASQQHNERTWGTASSRSVMGSNPTRGSGSA